MNRTDRLGLVSLALVADLLENARRAAGQLEIDPALADALRGSAAAVEAELILDIEH